MIAVGYLRVSTAGQRDEGVSLEAQEQAILKWFHLRCGPSDSFLGIHTDAISGSRADNRPGLEEALRVTCANEAVLVVYSLSRLARSTKDALEIAERLSRCRANLVSLSESIDTTTPGGKFVFTVFAAVAQLEKDQISERTRAALQYKKSQGQRVSRFAPYGFRFEQADIEGTAVGSLFVVADEGEQWVIRYVMDMHAAGYRSPRIAFDLTENGHPTRTGNPWRASSVRRIIACHGS